MNFDSMTTLAPEWILLVGGCVVLVAGLATGRSRRATASALTLATVLAALIAAVWLGDPTGRATIPGLWLTPLTAYVRLITLSVGLLIVLVNWHQPEPDERGEYLSLILFSLLGVLLTASANDLIVLFFAIELVSVPTYALIALSRRDSRASEAAVKYFFLGAMSAAILAYGFTLLYGATGTTTLFFHDGTGSESPLAFLAEMGPTATMGLLLAMAGLAFKIAAVPLHAYVADVYEGAAAPVTGLLGFVPKLAGFVALAKLFSACHWDFPPSVQWLIWIVAAATMTTGNVLALLQRNVKRMLAYSSIAHTGYMLIALLVGPVAGTGPLHDGVAAMLFYIALYGAMNLGAFALLSAFRIHDREIDTLDDLSGLAKRFPLASLGLAVCVFSLMGLPPTAGFLGKVYIFSSALTLDAAYAFRGPLIALAIIGVVNAAIGAAYYLRIVAVTYVGEAADGVAASGRRPVRIGLALCALPMLALFIWPDGLANSARDATASIRDTVGHRPTATVDSTHPAAPVPLSATSTSSTDAEPIGSHP